jgi:hypothetical protein
MNKLLRIIGNIQGCQCKTALELAEKQAEKFVTSSPEYAVIVLHSLKSKKKRMEVQNA